jgi:hypothetical protein
MYRSHKILISALVMMTLGSAAQASASKTIDCTDKAVQAKHVKLCKAVIDPSKFAHSEFAEVDCTGQLEDGYAVNLCKKVDLKEQRKLRSKYNSK